MRNSGCSFTRALGGITAALVLVGHAHADPVEPLVQAQTRFALTAHAPFAQVAPLFGPEWENRINAYLGRKQ